MQIFLSKIKSVIVKRPVKPDKLAAAKKLIGILPANANLDDAKTERLNS